MFGSESAARGVLAWLHDQIGAEGLVASDALPGLAAVIDQHAAAVRDILAAGVEGSAAGAGVVLLAGYARGVLDQAREMGWRPSPPEDPAGWAHVDWLTSRLLGVCSMARRIEDPRYRFELGDAAGPSASAGDG